MTRVERLWALLGLIGFVFCAGCSCDDKKKEAFAPELDRTLATPFHEAVRFLYDGEKAVQQGVVVDAIDASRVSVVRGRVQDREGKQVEDVTVTVLDHPEFGASTTRDDGMFDMAVHGGGTVTVRYEQSDFLPVQRQVTLPWHEFGRLSDVVLTPRAKQAATVNLDSGTMQVVQSEVSRDESGERKATLLFAPGTRATMTLPDGSAQGLSQLTVRAQEYTTGEAGAAAMPGELPPSSGYTYALDLSVDEAEQVQAKHVQFEPPLVMYVDNFLGFPAGTAVPSGAYDAAQARWQDADNGTVVKVLAIEQGRAVLDLNGDGRAESDAALTKAGIDAEERSEFGKFTAAGSTLWRVRVPHFSSWDLNWGFGPGEGAVAPGMEAYGGGALDDPCHQSGSDIECQNQTLGETLPIAGTEHALRYQSDRVAGRTGANSLEIPLTGETLPPGLLRVELEVTVLGQKLVQSFEAAPKLHHTFTWDGKDAYGRLWQSRQRAAVRIGYTYTGSYQPTSRFGSTGNGTPITGSRTRREVTLWKQFEHWIGLWEAKPLGFGGWSFSALHVYDPRGQTLYYGDGRRRTASNQSLAINTIAGTGAGGFSGDGTAASKAQVNRPHGLVVAADGTAFIADEENDRIRKITPDGVITTVAGTGTGGFSGDGGQAVQAQINRPLGLALTADGTLYLGDADNHRIRRITSDGVISTVAGTGQSGSAGDGGLATQATLMEPHALALGADGTLYVADNDAHVIRRISPSGRIERFIGTGKAGDNGDGGPAVLADIDDPLGLALSSDGTLYFTDWARHRVRAVGPDGTIRNVAGTGKAAFSGDFGPASGAELNHPHAIAYSPDGSLFITDEGNYRLRRISPDGIISTIAGNGKVTSAGDGGLAPRASFQLPRVVVVQQDRTVWVADFDAHRIRRIAPALPGLHVGELLIPSDEGAEVYVFNERGRHLRTLSRTGALRYTFEYDESGRLSTLTDGDGQATRIERNKRGEVERIVAPHGQVTKTEHSKQGYLKELTNPSDEKVRLNYHEGGLLSELIDPRGEDDAAAFTHQFEYDPQGYLIRDSNAAGGSKELIRSAHAAGWQVDLRTAEGRTTRYEVVARPQAPPRRVVVQPSGARAISSADEGVKTLTNPDGSTLRVETGPDPRFGMLTPVAERTTLKLPSGLTWMAEVKRTAKFDPNFSLAPERELETIAVSGNIATQTLDVKARTLTQRSPLGRTTVTTLDAQDRPIRVVTAGLEPLVLGYDAESRLSEVRQGTRRQTYTYAEAGFLAGGTDALGQVTSIEYDDIGRVLRATLPGERMLSFAWDKNSNLLSLTPPERMPHLFAYNAVDTRTSWTQPELPDLPTQTVYNYDRDHALIEVRRPDGVVNVQYDAAGRPTLIAHGPMGMPAATQGVPSDMLSLQYDAADRISALTHDGQTLRFAYDGPLVTGADWTGPVNGRIERVFNTQLRVQRWSVSGTTGSQAVNLSYDNDGLLTGAGDLKLTRRADNGWLQISTLGNLNETFSYNSFGELSSVSAKVGSTAFYQATLERDAEGRITRRNETLSGASSTWTYSYDAAGRLIQANKGNATAHSVIYDKNGNRLTHNGAQATFDAQDRLTQLGDTTYRYSAAGDLIEKQSPSGSTTYRYDLLGNLRRVTLPNGRVIDYIVDALGRRVGKKVDGKLTRAWLYHDALRPAAELDADGTLIATFIYASKRHVPDVLLKEGVAYRLLTDERGSVRLVVNANTGTIAQRLDYDPFGNITADTAPAFQPFAFAGGLYDPDTTLTRFGARDYDAQSGRWTTKDPTDFSGGDPNLYTYAYGDPINYIDPTGKWAWLVPIATGAAWGAASSVAIQLVTHNFNFHCVDWGEVGINAAFGATLGGVAQGLKFLLPAQGVSLSQSIQQGLINPSGKLGQILGGIEQGFAGSAPTSAVEALMVVEQAAVQAGLEAGVVISQTGGKNCFAECWWCHYNVRFRWLDSCSA